MAARATAAPPDVQAIVDDVAKVQPFWAQLPLSARGRYLRRTAQAIVDELDELRDIIAREHGTPRVEALTTELLPSVDALHWLAEAGPKVLAARPVRFRRMSAVRGRARTGWAPVGVVQSEGSGSSPFRHPLVGSATALMAGDGVVLRARPGGERVAERVARVFERAGLPAGLLRVVAGERELAAALARAGALPLFPSDGWGGAPAPAIVLADAALEQAVPGLLWAAFANAGQLPSSVGRVYVLRELAGHLTADLIAGTRRLRLGDPLSWDTEVGPLASPERREEVGAMVEEAVAAGGRLESGGPAAELGDAFFAPAILTGLGDESRLLSEPVPGPVLAVVEVDTIEEAVARASGDWPPFGASVWTSDPALGARVGEALRASAVWVNDHPVIRPPSAQDLQRCADPTLVGGPGPRVRRLSWHPYDETLGRAVQASIGALYGRDADRVAALRSGAGPLLRAAGRLARDAVARR